MGTELTKTQEQDALIKAYESNTGDKGKFLGVPRLIFNRGAVDKNGAILVDSDGDPLGMGSYSITGVEGHFKTVDFVITHVMNSYMRSVEVEPNKWKVESSTILFTDWKKDMLSSNGTLRCGRLSKKQIEAMDEDDAKKAKKFAPCYLHLFGLVTYIDEEGESQQTIAELRVGGGNFFTLNKAIQNVKEYSKYTFTLESDINNENESNVFGFITAQSSTKKVVITKELVEAATGFGEYITQYNQMITNQYKKAKRGEDLEEEATDAEIVDITEGIGSDDDDGVDVSEVFEEAEVVEETKPKTTTKKKTTKAKTTKKKKAEATIILDDGNIEDDLPF